MDEVYKQIVNIAKKYNTKRPDTTDRHAKTRNRCERHGEV